MNLRDLTEEQTDDLRRAAESTMKLRQNGSHARKQIDSVDYKLFFSDGVKAVLARITSLPK